jgi:hypothetical protein
VAIGTYMIVRAEESRSSRPGPQKQATEAAPSSPEPLPGAIVFEVKYRGLSKPDDPLSYRSYWGFGGPDGEKDSFVRAVKSQVKECTPVYNGSLPKAKWSVVELKDKKPIAFYFDANADGKLVLTIE